MNDPFPASSSSSFASSSDADDNKNNDNDEDDDDDDDDETMDSHTLTHDLHEQNNVPLDEQIAFHETILESLQKRMSVLDQEIEMEREKLKRHEQRIQELESREEYWKKARDENVVLLKGVTQTLEKCIDKLKKKQQVQQKVEKGGTDGGGVVSVQGEKNALEGPWRDVVEVSGTRVADSDSVHEWMGLDMADTTSGTFIQTDGNHDSISSNSSRCTESNNGVNKPLKSPLHPAKDLETGAVVLLQKPIQIFDKDYMEKRWAQNYPQDCAIFRFSPEETCTLLPLHPPFTSAESLGRIMAIAQREVLARREEMMHQKMHPSSSFTSAAAAPPLPSPPDFQKDDQDTWKDTVLDIFACSSHDLHLYEKLVASSQETRNHAVTIDRQQSEENDKDKRDTEHHHPSDISDKKSEIHVNQIICRKALFGKCNDPTCTYQHFSGRANLKTKSHKLRTVEIYRYEPEVVLPIDTCPFPPSLSQSEVQNCVDREEEEESKKRKFVESLALEQEEGAMEDEDEEIEEEVEEENYMEDQEQEVEQQEEEEELRVDEQEMEAQPQYDSSLFGSDESVAEEIEKESKVKSCSTDDAAFLAGSCEQDGAYRSRCRGISRGGPIVGDESFIPLPRLDHELDRPQVSSTIRTVLSDLDCSMEEIDLQGGYSDNLMHEPDKRQKLASLVDVLSSLGFDMMVETKDEEACSKMRYRSPFNFNSMTHFEKAINQAMLLNCIVSGVQLCIHAGRVDLTRAILDTGSEEYFSEECHIPPNIKENHFFIVKCVMDALLCLSEGSTCGRGTQSPNCIFHIGLFVATLSHYTQSYLETLLSYNDDSMDELEVYTTDLAGNLEIAIKSLFHDVEPAMTGNVKFYVIATELETSLNTLSNFTEIETCKKLSEFVMMGQRTARVVANEILALRDPQLVIDNVLFPLVNCLKSCLSGSLFNTSVDRKKTFNNICWSSKSSKQVAIFNLFGPGIFTSIAGVVHLMTNGSSIIRPMRPSHEGILIQLKQMVMQSIQYLDYSDTICDNLEGQLLLCPFFGILANVLVACHSYTMTHVLLVNALYAAHTGRNCAIYSDLLWSQLLQLHATFPHPKNRATEEMVQVVELLKIPFEYGCFPSKITLQGDHNLVNIVRQQSSTKLSNEAKCLEQMQTIALLCMSLASSTLGAGTNDNVVTNININLEPNNLPPTVPITLTEFPLSLCLLGRNLKSLCLQHCNLKSIPETFGDWFTELEVLKLSHNLLTKLPESVSKLYMLKSLNLDYNEFTSIPSAIRHLSTLKQLRVRHNKIKDVSALLECRNLEIIDIRNNIIQNMPIDLPLKLTKLIRYQYGN